MALFPHECVREDLASGCGFYVCGDGEEQVGTFDERADVRAHSATSANAHQESDIVRLDLLGSQRRFGYLVVCGCGLLVVFDQQRPASKAAAVVAEHNVSNFVGDDGTLHPATEDAGHGTLDSCERQVDRVTFASQAKPVE